MRPQPPACVMHWVTSHWTAHAGHWPAVSKVFHTWPQVQAQCAPPSGFQEHLGQQIVNGLLIPTLYCPPVTFFDDGKTC